MPERIAQMKLLGRRFSFSVDLSKVGCACNLALYLISMPARNIDWKPSPGHNRGGQPKYYCDANQVGGQWCPEIDIMEANSHAFQTTPHRCDDPTGGSYSNCDRGGCGQSTRDSPNAYGPGEAFTINTLQPFKVQTDFFEQSGTWTGMKTTLRQDQRKVVLDHGNCEAWYYEQMSTAISSGMSLRITYWGDQADTMQWLDMPPCGNEACGESAGNAIISGMAVEELPEEDSQGPSWATMVMRRYEDEPPVENSVEWVHKVGGMTSVLTGLLALAMVLLFACRLRRSHAGWKRLKDADYSGPVSGQGEYGHLLSGTASPTVCHRARGIANAVDAEVLTTTAPFSPPACRPRTRVLTETPPSGPLRYKSRTCDAGREEM